MLTDAGQFLLSVVRSGAVEAVPVEVPGRRRPGFVQHRASLVAFGPGGLGRLWVRGRRARWRWSGGCGWPSPRWPARGAWARGRGRKGGRRWTRLGVSVPLWSGVTFSGHEYDYPPASGSEQNYHRSTSEGDMSRTSSRQVADGGPSPAVARPEVDPRDLQPGPVLEGTVWLSGVDPCSGHEVEDVKRWPGRSVSGRWLP